MISIRSSADMARALISPIDGHLKRLLALRRDQLLDHDGYDLGDLAHFIVVEPNDTIVGIEGAAGVALTHGFEFVERHPCGWFEAVIILSDDGFGAALFVPDRADIDPSLLALMRDQA